jgi:hypothetical protein
MKYTVNTTDKTIGIEVSSPIELRDLIADLETIEGLYEGYTVTITPPPTFTIPTFTTNQGIDIQPYVQPHNPFPGQPGIVYCATNSKDPK